MSGAASAKVPVVTGAELSLVKPVGGGGALPCCAVDIGLGRVDGVGPGEGGGVLCASWGGEDEDCGESDCDGCGESFHFVIL
jgi:hypothetical protein